MPNSNEKSESKKGKPNTVQAGQKKRARRVRGLRKEAICLFRLPQEDALEAKKRATQAGLTFSEYLRQRVRGRVVFEARCERPGVVAAAVSVLASQLRRISASFWHGIQSIQRASEKVGDKPAAGAVKAACDAMSAASDDVKLVATECHTLVRLLTKAFEPKIPPKARYSTWDASNQTEIKEIQRLITRIRAKSAFSRGRGRKAGPTGSEARH